MLSVCCCFSICSRGFAYAKSPGSPRMSLRLARPARARRLRRLHATTAAAPVSLSRSIKEHASIRCHVEYANPCVVLSIFKGR
jgi:hypothetical protein